MRYGAIILACLATFATQARSGVQEDFSVNLYQEPGSPAAARDLLEQLEGVYKKRFQNSDISGEKYVSENIIEIVKANEYKAYIKIRLNFYNGHTCAIQGVAEYKKIGGFVYNPAENQDCYLTVRREGDFLTLSDPGYACRAQTCGARGGYSEQFPMKARREIRYMPLILKSKDYNDALKEAGLKN